MVQPIPQNPSQQLLHNRTTGNAQFWTYAHIWAHLFIQSDHLFALFIINLNLATVIIISSQPTTSAHFFPAKTQEAGLEGGSANVLFVNELQCFVTTS